MADEDEHHDLLGSLPGLRTTEDLIGLFETSGEAHLAEPIFDVSAVGSGIPVLQREFA